MAERKRKLRIDYGSEGLEIEVPESRTIVIEPNHRPGLADPSEQLRDALRKPTGAKPLRESVAVGQRVAISVCDITRPQPRREMLTAIRMITTQCKIRGFDVNCVGHEPSMSGAPGIYANVEVALIHEYLAASAYRKKKGEEY